MTYSLLNQQQGAARSTPAILNNNSEKEQAVISTSRLQTGDNMHLRDETFVQKATVIATDRG
jgi:hypothetical protein